MPQTQPALLPDSNAGAFRLLQRQAAAQDKARVEQYYQNESLPPSFEARCALLLTAFVHSCRQQDCEVFASSQ
jgi:hypothetical protein